MTALDVRIWSFGDPPVFPEIAEQFECEGVLVSASILQCGTTSGETSLGFNTACPTAGLFGLR